MEKTNNQGKKINTVCSSKKDKYMTKILQSSITDTLDTVSLEKNYLKVKKK
ncbi:hypothetical protein HNR74_002013 [Flammeovirga kamogawensis]|nr:hypothetical protein [Flammeovirga kamogawensis]